MEVPLGAVVSGTGPSYNYSSWDTTGHQRDPHAGRHEEFTGHLGRCTTATSSSTTVTVNNTTEPMISRVSLQAADSHLREPQ